MQTTLFSFERPMPYDPFFWGTDPGKPHVLEADLTLHDGREAGVIRDGGLPGRAAAACGVTRTHVRWVGVGAEGQQRFLGDITELPQSRYCLQPLWRVITHLPQQKQ